MIEVETAVKTLYDEDYYLRGQETGKSLYTDYRWLPELTMPMVQRMISYLAIRHGDTILDYGCARGYVVKAFHRLGYLVRGMDCSDWAIRHADPEVAGLCFHASNLYGYRADWIIAKDVLEHMDDTTLREWLREASEAARKGVFAVVPLSPAHGQPYVVPEYEQDITHIQRRNLMEWADLFTEYFPGFRIVAAHRVKGIKDNWAHYREGNGFITALWEMKETVDEGGENLQ